MVLSKDQGLWMSRGLAGRREGTIESNCCTTD